MIILFSLSFSTVILFAYNLNCEDKSHHLEYGEHIGFMDYYVLDNVDIIILEGGFSVYERLGI